MPAVLLKLVPAFLKDYIYFTQQCVNFSNFSSNLLDGYLMSSYLSGREYRAIFTIWKVSKYGVISGSYFPVFGPEITPYSDTFHAVLLNKIVNSIFDESWLNY